MNNQTGGRFMDGFIVGLLVGGLAVFFLGTEKGKKILRTLNEEGVFDFKEEEIKKILPKVKNKAKEFSEKAKETFEEVIEEVSENEDSNGESNGHSAAKSPVRRFFKRK